MSDSIRDAVSAAFEESEAATTSEPATAPSPPPTPEPAAAEAKSAPEAAPSAGAKSRDERGRFASSATATADPTKPANATEPLASPDARKDVAPGGPPPAPTEPPLKAPQSWKPQYRERWSGLPRDVQEEVLRVDREIRTTMEQAAQARKFHEDFQRTVSPFEAVIRAEGSDPMKMVGNLLQTAVALRTAAPAHKAQLIAQVIKSYGVPIDALDAALVGEQPAGGQAQQSIDPRMLAAQVRQEVLGGIAQQLQQSQRQKAAADAAAFEQDASNEFLEDVRDDMADILEVAARRNVALTLKEAYDRACQMNPNVRATLEQRKAAGAAANAQASTQRARVAASSVKSQPAGIAAGKELKSIRDAVEAAWESQG